MRPQTVFWLLLFFLLTACSSVTSPSPITTTPAATTPAGTFDGKWKGNGKSAEGIPFAIFFTVQNSTVTSTSYQFERPGFTPCFDVAHTILAPADRPHIVKDA